MLSSNTALDAILFSHAHQLCPYTVKWNSCFDRNFVISVHENSWCWDANEEWCLQTPKLPDHSWFVIHRVFIYS